MHPESYYKQFLNNNPHPRVLMCRDKKKNLLNFSSNDYLGISQHPLLISRSQEYAKRFGVGSTSSRLVAGNFAWYEAIEQQLADAIGKPTALILGSGYQTNTTVLEALLDPKIIGNKAAVFCDRYCHVSMLATTQHLSRLHRFRHNDLQHLQELLERHAIMDQPTFILVESVYSMDGDQINFDRLITLAKQYNAILYVDDAHAVGIYGPEGWGKGAEYANDIDIVMGTFSKALGSFGSYVACSTLMRDYLINKCRGLIYSTALSPAVLGAIAGAIELVPTLHEERKHLFQLSKTLRQFMQKEGIDCGDADTHIVPWIVGDANKALHITSLLEEKGILAATIRPPSVPSGKSRIRFCLSAAHSDEDMDKLMRAIHEVAYQID